MLTWNFSPSSLCAISSSSLAARLQNWENNFCQCPLSWACMTQMIQTFLLFLLLLLCLRNTYYAQVCKEYRIIIANWQVKCFSRHCEDLSISKNLNLKLTFTTKTKRKYKVQRTLELEKLNKKRLRQEAHLFDSGHHPGHEHDAGGLRRVVHTPRGQMEGDHVTSCNYSQNITEAGSENIASCQILALSSSFPPIPVSPNSCLPVKANWKRSCKGGSFEREIKNWRKQGQRKLVTLFQNPETQQTRVWQVNGRSEMCQLISSKFKGKT